MRRLRQIGWRLLPGGISSVAVVLATWGGWQPLEQAVYTALFQLRGTLPWSDQVVVIEIDDASLRQLGRFPFARQHYVQLLDQLSEAQPNIVAFDLIWSESSPDDLQLKAAMERHGLVVLAEAQDGMGLPLSPTPDLAAGAIATGHILKQTSSDGLTHKIELQIRQQAALSVAVLQVRSLVQDAITLPSSTEALWINWLSPVEQAPHYSFVDVLGGEVPAQVFQDKIVLVGVTATGLDPLITPFNRDLPTSGVYLQATAINNLLQENFLRVLAQRWVLLGLFAAGPVLSWCLSRWRSELQVAVWVGLCLGWVSFSLVMFRANYWLPIASPIGLFTGTLVAVAVGDRLQLNRLLQREVEHLWQTHYQDVVSYRKEVDSSVWSSPESSAASYQVTQLAELAEQFGRSQSAQAAIARSLPIGLLAADLDGQIWFCNPLAAAWLGVQVGDRLHSYLIPHWLSEAEWQADLSRLKANGFAQSRQLERGESWFEIKLEPLVYATAPTSQPALPLDGLLLVLNDITERQAIARMKDEFVSVVSHELRTPITSIRGSLGLLGTGRLGSLNDKGQRMLEIAINNTDRLIRLINDILDLERIESGKIALSKQLCDLAELIQQAAETMQSMADNAGVMLSVSAVSVRFMGDSDRLLQVFTNLLSNAIKFSSKGDTVWVTAEIQNQPEPNQSPPTDQLPHPSFQPPTLLIRIKDQGRGIPADKLDLIFERFQQVDVSDARQKGGTGLGLPICSAIVQQHGGKIWVESQLDVGSTFYVMLPGTID